MIRSYRRREGHPSTSTAVLNDWHFRQDCDRPPSASRRATEMCRMKSVVMLYTAAPGGISQVVANLRDSPLFAQFHIRTIATHDRGSVWKRLLIFLRALSGFVVLLLRRDIALVHAHVAMRGSFWRK